MPINHNAGTSGPITGISSMASRHVLAELAEAYTRRCGQPVHIESVGGVDAERRVQAGESFDFVVLAGGAINRLSDADRIDASSRMDLARSGVAIAVKKGAPHPDVQSEAAVRRAVLAARSVGYSTGPSGSHLIALFERWGIADAIAPRIVKASPGTPVGTLIARGEVELGFQQLSELVHLPGIEVVGPLASEIQVVTVFAAAVCATSTRCGATRELLSFLASPEADSVKLRHGMEPA
jgi:molybdate transport system substrate-binding protein